MDGAPGEDNMGGQDGKVGDTSYECLEITSPQTVTTAAGQTVWFAHHATNWGNLPSLINLRAQSSLGYPSGIYTDPDDDGKPDSSRSNHPLYELEEIDKLNLRWGFAGLPTNGMILVCIRLIAFRCNCIHEWIRIGD